MSSFKKAAGTTSRHTSDGENSSCDGEQQDGTGLLPGTRRWVDGTLLVSTGHSGLDSLIGGGIPVGGIICLESDGTCALASTLSSLFLAEGLAAGHDIVVGRQDDTSCAEILRCLPFNLSAGSKDNAAAAKRDAAEVISAIQHQQPLILAPAYNKYMRCDSTDKVAKYCHTYDLNRNVPSDVLDGARIIDWKVEQSMLPIESLTTNGNVCRLYMHHFGKGETLGPWTQLHTVAGHFATSAARCIGGAFGFDGCDPEHGGDEHIGICRAIKLKAQIMGVKRFMQQSAAATVCMVHINTASISTSTAMQLRALCDINLKVHSFSDPMCSLSLGSRFSGHMSTSVGGVAKEFSDCHGLLQVRKLVRPGGLSTGYRDDVLTYTLKRDRKKLIVEKPHLPPEHDIASAEVSSFACASNTSAVMDF
jgi:hypothetical protein